MNLDKAITIVKEHIEEKIGGNVTTTKNPEIGMVMFSWKKNERTLVEERYQQAFSYEDLEQNPNPVIMGKAFVEAYKNPKPVVEELKKQSRKKKVEEPVDDIVQLIIEESAEPTTEEVQNARPVITGTKDESKDGEF